MSINYIPKKETIKQWVTAIITVHSKENVKLNASLVSPFVKMDETWHEHIG